jgi:hypothetical protein
MRLPPREAVASAACPTGPASRFVGWPQKNRLIVAGMESTVAATENLPRGAAGIVPVPARALAISYQSL